jgi:ATP-binding cassette subfamily C (CFTR/MRP) protein 1
LVLFLEQNATIDPLAVNLITVNLLPSADYIIALGGNGDVVEQGTFEELNKNNGYVRSFSVQQSKQQPQNTEPAGKFALGPMPTSGLSDAMEDKKRQMGDLKVYMYYFRTLGKMVSFLLVFFAAAHGFFFSFPSKLRLWLPILVALMLTVPSAVWLKWWSDANAGKPTQRLGLYLGVYSAFEVTAVVFLGLLVWYGMAEFLVFFHY